MNSSLTEPLSSVYTPSSLNQKARQLLESGIGSIVVEGEISSLAKPPSGHLYFTLKDNQAQVRCAWFRQRIGRSRLSLENGLKVRVMAQVSLYEPRGDYQLIVTRVEAIGAGDLQRELQQRIERLKAAGLFESERKQRLPMYPQRLSIVSSRSAAAVQDVLNVIRRRWPLLQISLCHASVQGEQAPAELIEALGRAEAQAPDLILITRGGGSLEDLWAFNDEGLARAIADCSIPVVSAVGHQTDHSISDMVADMAAPTPSAAAELITPDKADLSKTFDRILKQLQRLHGTGLQLKSQQLDILSSRLDAQHPARRIELTHNRLGLFQSRLQQIIGHRLLRAQNSLDQLSVNLKANSPHRRVTETRARLADLDILLQRTMQHRLEASRSRLQTQLRTLQAISPMTVLQRGYSVTRGADDKTIQSINVVSTGDEIRTTLTDGELRSTVTTVTSSDA